MPDEYEEKARFILSEYEFWSKNRVRAINRLHSIIANTGLTTVTKKEMCSCKKRKNLIDNIQGNIKKSADRLEDEITRSDRILKDLEKEITELLRVKKDKTEIIMSVDGIGKITSLAILGYIGDGNRFSNAGQVSYYAGLVPRVDISGDTAIYGKIIKRGCHQLKRCLIQCAWATIRSKNESALKNKFEELRKRKGKKKAIVAIARKLIELVYTLLVKGEKNKYMPLDILANKLALYKIC
jgi:transposase